LDFSTAFYNFLHNCRNPLDIRSSDEYNRVVSKILEKGWFYAMNLEKIKAYRDFYHAHLLEDCIPFWMNSDLLDKEYGGYISSVDQKGKCYNTDKSVWFQGRGLWTFSALCLSPPST